MNADGALPTRPDPAPAAPVAPVAASWYDWRAWRDRLLISPRFRAAAERWWPARWVARRRAAQLFDLCAGFVYSQLLLAALRCGLFERLAAGGPQTLAQLAPQLGLSEPAAERLLQGAVALRLLERRSAGRYGLGPLGAPLVGNTGLRAMVEHHSALYQDLSDPLALLRRPAGQGNALAAYWPYAGNYAGNYAGKYAGSARPQAADAAQVAAYSQLMASSLPWVAAQLLQAYPVARHRRWLDVGGGEGALAQQLAQTAPQLQLTVFDLPAVAARAGERFAAAGLAARCSARGGSFFSDALPEGHDAISLVRVLHDHDDPAVLVLLRAARAALLPGGRLLVLEPLRDGGAAMADAYFGLYLWAMGSGRARSATELTALLQQAGFQRVRQRSTAMPLLAGLLVAEG